MIEPATAKRKSPVPALRISKPDDPSFAIYMKTGEKCQILDYAPAVRQYFCHVLAAGIKVWIPRSSLKAITEEPASALVVTEPPVAGDVELEGDVHLTREEREALLNEIRRPRETVRKPARAYMAVGSD